MLVSAFIQINRDFNKKINNTRNKKEKIKKTGTS